MEMLIGGKVTLHCGDCLEVMAALEPDSVDSIVTDAPYHLGSIVERFGGDSAAPAKSEGGTGVFKRSSAGFMGQKWDGGDIAYRPETWAHALRVLKPGGHIAAFGPSRGYHRMACAIEDAGFEIRDSLLNMVDSADSVVSFLDSLNDAQLGAFLNCMDNAEFSSLVAWVYGTGFPKSQNVAKFIDRKLGVKGSYGNAKTEAHQRYIDTGEMRGDTGQDGWQRPWMDDPEAVANAGRVYLPASDEAREFDGFGTALKPAFEPIVLARKPLSEKTIAANVLRWRTGAMNIEECKVPYEDGAAGPNNSDDTLASIGSAGGRWPANVVHDGSDEVVGTFPSLGKSAGGQASLGAFRGGKVFGAGKDVRKKCDPGYGDSGSAARFFYSAKASKADRAGSKHPTVKPVALMRWLVRLVTPPGGTVLDLFAGTGVTGEAAVFEGFKCHLIEREAEYQDDIRRRMSLIEAGPEQRERILLRARNQVLPPDELPLFKSAA